MKDWWYFKWFLFHSKSSEVKFDWMPEMSRWQSGAAPGSMQTQQQHIITTSDNQSVCVCVCVCRLYLDWPSSSAALVGWNTSHVNTEIIKRASPCWLRPAAKTNILYTRLLPAHLTVEVWNSKGGGARHYAHASCFEAGNLCDSESLHYIRDGGIWQLNLSKDPLKFKTNWWQCYYYWHSNELQHESTIKYRKNSINYSKLQLNAGIQKIDTENKTKYLLHNSTNKKWGSPLVVEILPSNIKLLRKQESKAEADFP